MPSRKKNGSGFSTDQSPFGGTKLESIEALDADSIEMLNQLGFSDTEQILAAAAVEGTQQYLEEVLGQKETSALIKMLREKTANSQLAMLEAVPSGPNSLGAVEPDEEVQSLIAAATAEMAMEAAPVAIPPMVNHALKMSPVRNQGSRGTCVSFALTAMHEFYRRQSGTAQDFSEQFLYHKIKQMDGAPGTCGTWAVKGAQVISNVGECRESIWPYNPNLPCNNNGVMPGNAMGDAAGYKLPTIVLNPKDVGAIKNALAGGSVCEFSIPVYNSWYQSAATRLSGRITMRLGSEPYVGGHAMCLIGYQDDASSPGGGFFMLRNSWGPTWGSTCPYGAGNGTIPYAYLVNDGWEAVTTPPPRRRYLPWDWWRWRERPLFGEGDEQQGAGRRTIIIEAGDADIIIR
jgi:C1A family cysteine protease